MSGNGHGGSCRDNHGGHNHGGHNHAHDHDHGNDIGGEEWSLYKRVILDQVVCLNESDPGSGTRVLRPWHARLDQALPQLESNTDHQLLLCIPFTSPVKIKSICVIGGGGEASPSELCVFVNDENLDFQTADQMTPVQNWELAQENPDGRVEYPTKYSRFQNVYKLWMYFHRNFGGDVTRIMYIGFKGEYTTYKREPVQAVYELRPVAAAKRIEDSAGARMGM